jgi:hypothetical protein
MIHFLITLLIVYLAVSCAFAFLALIVERGRESREEEKRLAPLRQAEHAAFVASEKAKPYWKRKPISTFDHVLQLVVYLVGIYAVLSLINLFN